MCLSESSPSRGRGLKSACYRPESLKIPVVPLAGTWIEINVKWLKMIYGLSSPSRGRGLKFLCGNSIGKGDYVVPLAGTWIEIELCGQQIEGEKCRPPRGDVD